MGLPEKVLDHPIAELDPCNLVLVRLARALALGPEVAVFEHPTAEVAPADLGRLAARSRAVTSRRNIATVVLTADRDFAAAAATRVLQWEAATGRLAAKGGWLSHFLRS